MTKPKAHKPPNEKAPETPANEQPPAPEPDPREQELADLKAKLLRLHADFDNHRKRLLRERQDMALQAHADLMLELLPVLDNLDRGREVAAQRHADQAIRDGFEMIISQLDGILSRFGLSKIDDLTGKPFDPNVAEAVSYPSSPDKLEGTVIAETRRGYLLHGKLLRAAQTVVSSGPARDAEHQEITDISAEE